MKGAENYMPEGQLIIEKSGDITDETKKPKEESAPSQHSLLLFTNLYFLSVPLELEAIHKLKLMGLPPCPLSFPLLCPLQLIPIPPKLSFSEREKRKLRSSSLQAALVVPLVDADNLIEPFKPFLLLLISHPHQVVHLL